MINRTFQNLDCGLWLQINRLWYFWQTTLPDITSEGWGCAKMKAAVWFINKSKQVNIRKKQRLKDTDHLNNLRCECICIHKDRKEKIRIRQGSNKLHEASAEWVQYAEDCVSKGRMFFKYSSMFLTPKHPKQPQWCLWQQTQEPDVCKYSCDSMKNHQDNTDTKQCLLGSCYQDKKGTFRFSVLAVSAFLKQMTLWLLAFRHETHMHTHIFPSAISVWCQRWLHTWCVSGATYPYNHPATPTITPSQPPHTEGHPYYWTNCVI